jgi:hypothetical protein
VSPRVTGPTTRQGRAPVSPCVLRLQTRLLVRESSGVATCPVPPGPPPRQGRSLVSPRVLRLQARLPVWEGSGMPVRS